MTAEEHLAKAEFYVILDKRLATTHALIAIAKFLAPQPVSVELMASEPGPTA